MIPGLQQQNSFVRLCVCFDNELFIYCAQAVLVYTSVISNKTRSLHKHLFSRVMSELNDNDEVVNVAFSLITWPMRDSPGNPGDYSLGAADAAAAFARSQCFSFTARGEKN